MEVLLWAVDDRASVWESRWNLGAFTRPDSALKLGARLTKSNDPRSASLGCLVHRAKDPRLRASHPSIRCLPTASEREPVVLKTVNVDASASAADIAAAVREVWPEAKVVHVKGPRPSGDIRDFYWQFFEAIGEPLPIAEDVKAGSREAQRTGGYWFEVRYDPAEQDAYRHSANAQPLHTDMSYIPIPNSVGFLACVAMPERGGATTFVDAEDVVEVLLEENPDLLKALSESELPHSRSGDRRVEKVVRLDRDKPLLNWNYYCVDPDVDDRGQNLRDQFFHFLQTSVGIAARMRRVKLSPGDAVLWKDEQVLHGRDSFDAESPAERFLWKSGLLVHS